MCSRADEPGRLTEYDAGSAQLLNQNERSTSMATTNLTADTFKDVVGRSGITLVDWWAEWCGPCRMFAPVFEKASEQHPDIVFGKIDTEAEPQLSAAAQIMSIPTLMAFRDGVLVFSQPGALPEKALAQVIEAVRDLDMDDVRRQLDEQTATTTRKS
jgi:thioredoxin 1